MDAIPVRVDVTSEVRGQIGSLECSNAVERGRRKRGLWIIRLSPRDDFFEEMTTVDRFVTMISERNIARFSRSVRNKRLQTS